MARIRTAFKDDVDALVDLCALFAAESDVGIPISESHIRQVLLAAMASPQARVIVADDGGDLVGLVAGHLQGSVLNDETVAMESVFFVTPSERGKVGLQLMTAFEAWAKDEGANRCAMVEIAGSNAGSLYRRRGYVEAETVFHKVI